MDKPKRFRVECHTTPPVEGGVLLQDVHVDVLLYETVEQDGQRGETDVVQGQVGRVVQRLGEKGRHHGLGP